MKFPLPPSLSGYLEKAHPEVMLSWMWGAQDVDWKEADLLEINSFRWKKDWTGIQAIDSDMWCGRVLSWCAEQQAGSLSSSPGGKSSAWHHSSLFRMWVLSKNRLWTTIWLCVFACSLLHPSCMTINSFFGQRSFLTQLFFSSAVKFNIENKVIIQNGNWGLYVFMWNKQDQPVAKSS